MRAPRALALWSRGNRRALFAASVATSTAMAIVTLAFAAPRGPHAAAPARDAAARPIDGGASVEIGRIPPDPPPLVARHAWIFDLRYDKGDIYLLEVHPIDLGAPQATPRVMGRFALELFEGPTLIERVRFDFPFLGAGDLPLTADAGRKEKDDARMLGPLDKNLRSRIGVLVPATKRGTRLELWDRATNRRWPLPWPPVEGPAKARGAHDAAPDGG